MSKLEVVTQQKVDEQIELAKTESAKGNAEAALNHFLTALDILPESKDVYEDGHFIVKYIIQVCLKFNRLEQAHAWALKIYDYGKERFDGGEREYLHGRVEFAMKNMDKARELFKIAFKKSEGRFPAQKDAEYIKLLL